LTLHAHFLYGHCAEDGIVGDSSRRAGEAYIIIIVIVQCICSAPITCWTWVRFKSHIL